LEGFSVLNAVAKVERVLAAVTGLLLFTLNDVRMYQTLPRGADGGHAHAAWLRLMGGTEQVYLSSFDLGVRYGLAAVVVALCAWAVVETFQRVPVTE
jgi:hypothetical protein